MWGIIISMILGNYKGSKKSQMDVDIRMNLNKYSTNSFSIAENIELGIYIYCTAFSPRTE